MLQTCDGHHASTSMMLGDAPELNVSLKFLVSTLWKKRQKERGKILEEMAILSREVKGDFSSFVSPGNSFCFLVSGFIFESGE